MFYDLDIKGNNYSTNLKIAKEAEKFGWNHINFSYSPQDFKEALTQKNDLESNLHELTVDFTLNINSTNPNEIRKISKKFRNKSNCISVIGGDLKVNRAVCENVKIDILSRPYANRKDCGLNQVLAKEAVENNVAIELSFKDILNTYLSHRAKIISNFKDIYTLYRKFNFPLLISSKAESIWDIRSVKDISAFFKSTGLNDDEINNALSKTPEDILNFNKNRENFIFKDVKVIK